MARACCVPASVQFRGLRAAAIAAALVAWLAAAPAAAQGQSTAAVTTPAAHPLSDAALAHAAGAAVRGAGWTGGAAPRAAGSGPATPNRSWDALVAAVKVGARVRVTLADATSVDGRLAAIDARAITVDRPGGPRTMAAADVRSVRDTGARRRRVKRAIAIGIVAAAAAMVAIDQRSDKPEPMQAALMGGALIGLPLGLIAGIVAPDGPPLYEAPPGAIKAP